MITERNKRLQEEGLAKGRPLCALEGCNNLANPRSHKRDVRGERKYNKLCATHHKQKYGIEQIKVPEKLRYRAYIDRTKCSLCNWGGPCDTHRVTWGENGGKYVKGNVLPVCPNCHRLIHKRILNISSGKNLPLSLNII